MAIPKDPVSSTPILQFRQRTERDLVVAAEALSESNERFQLALDAGQLGEWNWDSGTDELTLGRRAAKMFGLQPGVPYSRARVRELLHPEDAERAREALDRALAERSDYAIEYRVNRADGSQCWVAASGRGRYADDGTVLGMTGVMQDVTKRKREVQALREVDARKDEFLATLAHELRNPLAPVRMSLEILRQQGISKENEETARGVILRQVAQMVALIDDLFDISRISLGRIELNRGRVPLAEVLESALEIARPLIEARGHYLSLQLAAQPVHLDVDRTRIAQVLSNLLNNAAKYSGRNGRIRLSTAVDGDDLVVTVADSGIGIAPGDLSRVFEMFVRVDNSLERAESGLGVGLTLARRLAELHGGTLEARSAGLGQGSEFILRLKTVPGPDSDALPRANAGKAPEELRRRILIVDDNVDHAESLATLLRLDGHEVRTAYSGLKAIDAVAAAHPEVVLLDLGMPGLNGYDTARRIRALDRSGQINLIAISGWGQPRDRKLSQESGFDRHLVKPVDPEELKKLLASVPRAGKGAAQPARALRVLVADDNAALQESLTYLLQEAGCEVRAAPDGVAAVKLAKEWLPDVVFVDIHMPGLNGFQVAKQLRGQFAPGAMKLILMSGVSIDEALTKDAKRAGFDACVDKVAQPDVWLRHLAGQVGP